MIQKIGLFLAGAFLAILGMAVVAQAETVRGEGRYMANTLTHLTPFKAIDVRADAQVDIWQGNAQRVSVNGKSNLVALADIRVEEETLIIDFKRPVQVKGDHALHVTVALPTLEAVSVKGNGRVRIRGAFEASQLSLVVADKAYLTGDWLQIDALRVQATQKAEVDLDRLQVKQLQAALFDKAEMELSGFAQQAQLVNHGSQELEAEDLRVEDAHVQVTGSGDVTTFATQTLQAEVLGRGNVEYHGTPVLTRKGDVKRIASAFAD